MMGLDHGRCAADDTKADEVKKDPPEKSSAQSPMEGVWEGTLKISAIELRLGFQIKRKNDGSFTGTMDSLDQGVRDLPLSSVTVKDNQITLEFKLGGIVYSAQLSEDEQTLKGTFEQAMQKFPLVLHKKDKPTVLNRPQEPKPPFPYKSEEVTIDNPKAEKVTLAGTLTLPEGQGPFTAVIMITGSGPQNRDEEILGHKPFWVIADHLTRQGIAVLRCDDRGVGKSKGNFAKATSADFATDILACVNYLKTRPEINPKKIGLMGHSEGGLIAPMVAVESPDVAFIVLLAGTGIRGDEILRKQRVLIAQVNKANQKAFDRSERMINAMVAIIENEPDEKKASAAMLKFIEDEITKITSEEWQEFAQQLAGGEASKDEKTNKNAEEQFRTQYKAVIAQLNSPWMRFFLSYDPYPTLTKVRCPVLAINGELDLQVPCEENLKAIAKALEEGGNKNVTIKAFPKLNHLFQHTETGHVGEYGKIEETFATHVLEFLSEWIKKQ